MRLVSIFCLCLFLVQISFAATPRIINGTRADNWPWMAAIIYANMRPENGQFCGGTLIHPSWILTAGHCTDGETIYSIKVLLGQKTLTEAREIIGIKRIIRHPDYEAFSDSPGSDIALLQLEKPSTQAVLRVAARYSDLNQDMATVIGWGEMADGSYADSLQQTTLPIVSNEVCNARKSYNGDVLETMLCAGFANGRTDACSGDSGGPLVVETDRGWQQVGIVSWGEGCALPNYYGVYTRVSLFQDFITEHICEDIPPTPSMNVSIEGQKATLFWSQVTGAKGYQFYYKSISFLDDIHSFNFGMSTGFSVNLHENYIVAVRAYQDNCYSAYSNVGTVIMP